MLSGSCRFFNGVLRQTNTTRLVVGLQTRPTKEVRYTRVTVHLWPHAHVQLSFQARTPRFQTLEYSSDHFSRYFFNSINMPRDVSSSSSEDEASNPPAEASFRQKHVERSSKYQCPDDFVCFSHKPCSSTLTESLKSSESELWLIKAPANFDPRCLRGASVNLSGFQTLNLPSASAAGDGHGQQVYNILASNHGTADLRLLTAASSSPVVAPAFSGLLSVCESYGGARAPPCVIHAAPTPAIPPGLKQRFQPFGSKTPTTAQETQDEDRKRKKKKKKDKHIKKEEEVRVKQEVEETGQEHTEEKSSRKRKKVKEEVAVMPVKQELKRELDVGALYNDDSSAKKKKKRKKSKMDAE